VYHEFLLLEYIQTGSSPPSELGCGWLGPFCEHWESDTEIEIYMLDDVSVFIILQVNRLSQNSSLPVLMYHSKHIKRNYILIILLWLLTNEITLNSNRVSSPLLNVHWTYKRFKNTKLGIYVIEVSEKKSEYTST